MSVDKFHKTVKRLRAFFDARGLIEVHPQSKLSILAACEDPLTVSTYDYAGDRWPLPQTGQMWLESYLLKNPEEKGFYCVTTSYRDEPNPIPGRHDLIFPMFEFECPGTIDDLLIMEYQLCYALGLGQGVCVDYETEAADMDVHEIGIEEEQMLWANYGNVVMLRNFPVHTSPFWNMKVEDGIASKVDVIVYGVETIGSAERGTDPEVMRESFYTISDGKYANILFDQFGVRRVADELEAFLSHDFFPRFGGGIGLTRLMRAMP